MAIRLASSAGWWYGKQKPPGPIRMCFVWRNPSTTSRSGDGCGFHTMELCSPLQNSSNPSASGPMMVREAEATGADADVVRLADPFHQEQVRRRMRFPPHGMLLADPELLEPELIGADDVLQRPLVAVLETPLRRMTGHREYAEL